MKLPIPGVKKIIAVVSGKGGVGKSAVAVQLAVLLAEAGYKIGLLDADIYGPSAPTMLGAYQNEVAEQPQIVENLFVPLNKHGIKFISVGLLVNDSLIWRAPMITKMLHQLLTGTIWITDGELDVLIVDTPPGTGDIQLSLYSRYEIFGSILVSTNHKIAISDTHKSAQMCRKLDVNIIGIVENMRDNNSEIVEQYSILNDIQFLGSIPRNIELANALDEGTPMYGSLLQTSATLSKAFETIIGRVIATLAREKPDKA